MLIFNNEWFRHLRLWGQKIEMYKGKDCTALKPRWENQFVNIQPFGMAVFTFQKIMFPSRDTPVQLQNPKKIIFRTRIYKLS